jgi:hypothetical protein
MRLRKRPSSTCRLALERLESRILLAAVNPGDTAILFDGDQLFFIQGETEAGEETVPSDGPGEIREDWITIVSFFGPGHVELEDSLGNSFIDNGGKIGNITFYDTTLDSQLYIQTGVFLEDYSLTDVPDPLEDRPDTLEGAEELTVPSGESGAEATYNTGRLIVGAVGSSEDWYKFSAQEAEEINVAWTGPGNIEIYTQYGTGPVVYQADNSYTIGDDNTNATLDDVTVYLHVPSAGGPYAMVVDRVEQNGVLGNTTVTEDFPDSFDAPLDIAYNDGDQTGVGSPLPTFSFFGEGGGNDYFSLTLLPGETLDGSSFSNVSEVRLLDGDGFLLHDLFGGSYENTGEGDLDIVMNVVSTGNWSFDIDVIPPLLSNIVELNTNDDGFYVWWTGSSPWMHSYIPDGAEDPVHLYAPEGSGGAVVTGDVMFNGGATGLGRLAIDGSLKGSVGTSGMTLGAGETVGEVMVGYVHGYENLFHPTQPATTGGVYLDGDLLRFIVRNTVAEIAGGDFSGPDSQVFGPASFFVDGFFMEFQASGTIFADLQVEGNSTAAPVIDLDLLVGSDELYSIFTDQGRINDTQDAAYVVGSPTDQFWIQGTVTDSTLSPSAPADKWDAQDWYTFTPGLGQEITVAMDSDTNAHPAYVYTPAGRTVAVLWDDESYTFFADEPGNYYISVGTQDQPDRIVPLVSYSMDYTIAVEGVRPTGMGGVVVGSNLFGTPEVSSGTADGTMFGDDIDTAAVSGGTYGFIDVRGDGTIGYLEFDITGHLGLLTAAAIDGYLGVDPWFLVGGNLDKIESRTGDFQLSYMWVGENLGELLSGGELGGYVTLTPDIDVDGAVGSVLTAGDFMAQMTVLTDGVDFFHVGGNFGSSLEGARLDTAAGTDVAFAYVAGDTWYNGFMVYPVVYTGGTLTHVDDGGGILELRPAAAATNIIFPTGSPLSYRYLPIGRPGGFTVGAVITEINATQGVTITTSVGHVDVCYVRFGTLTFQASSSLTVNGSECDIYFVTSGGFGSNRISNNTRNGDIVNIYGGGLSSVYAGGSVGATERYLEAGRLPNPNVATFSPPAIPYVTGPDTQYFNGVLVGLADSIAARNFIGDVYVGGPVDELIADSNGSNSGQDFYFRGVYSDGPIGDGIIGVVYAGSFGEVDPGRGIYGGMGETPVGGVFSAGVIERFSASNATVAGPVMAADNVFYVDGVNTAVMDTVIGAGAHFSDWALWDQVLQPGTTAEIGRFRLTGPGSILDSVRIETGVLDRMDLKDTAGWWDTVLIAVGNPLTGEGINRIKVQGGGMNGGELRSNQNIGRVEVKDADIADLDIISLKRIDRIKVKNGDIQASGAQEITAPLGIGKLEADNITDGALYIGASQVEKMKIGGNVTSDIYTDGGFPKLQIKGSLFGDLYVTGALGFIGKLDIKGSLLGDVNVAGGHLEQAKIKGNMTNASIIANTIGSVKVKGLISSAAADVIWALSPFTSFEVSDTTKKELISVFNNFVNFSGLTALVGP